MKKISIYSTAFNAIEKKFDYKDALDNWAVYADQISIAIGTSVDDTYGAIEAYAKEKNYPVSLIRTTFDFSSDPYAYGYTENAALQNCDGQILIQQNLDERFRCDKQMLQDLSEHLLRTPFIQAYFVPVINLYGSNSKYLDIQGKWYIHKRGYYRGPVKFGLKEDGRPDYNITSTDELIDHEGRLPQCFPLLRDPALEPLTKYVETGMPLVYHVGYVNLNDRLERSLWWKQYWEGATGGDKNKHPTSIEELANRETKEHGLPLWPTVNTDQGKDAVRDGVEYFKI